MKQYLKVVLFVMTAMLAPTLTYAIQVPWNKDVAGRVYPPVANDNVGIGTTSPFAKLTVGGTTYLGGNLTATGTVVFTAISDGCLNIALGLVGSTGAACGSGSGVWPFVTTDTNYAVAVQSTTTPEWFKSGVFASSTSRFVYASTTALSANTIHIADGSAILPSVSFSTSTGLYLTGTGASNVLNFSIGGTRRVTFDTTGRMDILGDGVGFVAFRPSGAAAGYPDIMLANAATLSYGEDGDGEIIGLSPNGEGAALAQLQVNTGGYTKLLTGLTLSSFTSNGFLKTTGGNGVVAVDTTLYAPFPFTPVAWGNSTSTTIGLLNGFLSTASSTINAPLRLTGLTGGLYGGTGGLVGTFATTTASCSGDATCTPFTVIGNTPVDISATAGAGAVDGTGFAGMMTAWLDSNTVISTSTIVGAQFIATSTATSSLPRLLSTGGAFTWLCLDNCRTTWPVDTTLAWPWSPTTNYAVAVNATTGIPWFQNGLHSSSTARLVYASSTAQTITGDLYATRIRSTLANEGYINFNGSALIDNNGVSSVNWSGHSLISTAGATAFDYQNATALQLNGYTTNGFVKTSSSNGTLTVDTTTYETGLTAGDGLTRTGDDFACDTASGSVFGCLSSADWTTFNNKGSGTVTSVQTNNGLTGGEITTTGTIGLNVTGLSTNGLITWNGSNLFATGTTGSLTVPRIIATSTATSTFAGGIDAARVCITGSTLCLNAGLALTGTTLTAGNGLTGGGDLSANRTFTVGVENGLAVSADAVGLDITGYPVNNLILTYNGTRIVATGTPALTTGYFIATTTTASAFPYASTTMISATTASTSDLYVSNLTSALIQTGASGLAAEYAGTSCTNQFVRSLSALGIATCATVGAADVSLANLTATDSTLTFSGTYNGSTARTIGLNVGNANTWTALQTFGASLTVPNSSTNIGLGTTSPWGYVSVGNHDGSEPIFVVASSSPAVSTTTHLMVSQFGQTVVNDVPTAFTGVVSPMRYLSTTIATTSTWTGTTTGTHVKRMLLPFGGTIRNAKCHADAGFLNVDIYHTSTHLPLILGASSTVGTINFSSNNTFTSGEILYLSAGTTTTSLATALACTIGITETPR